MSDKLCLSFQWELGFIFHPSEDSVKGKNTSWTVVKSLSRGAFAVRAEGLLRWREVAVVGGVSRWPDPLQEQEMVCFVLFCFAAR